MKVIDFVQDKSDCMNEKDFLNVLNALADQFVAIFALKRYQRGDGVSAQLLIANFLMQDIEETTPGKYTFMQRPHDKHIDMRI